MYDIFFQPVNNIIPIKENTKKALARLGIYLLRDLIFYKPISYNIINNSSDFTTFRDGMLVQIDIKIDEISKSSSRRSPTKIYVSNNTGSAILVFFNKIPAFIYNSFKIGSKHTIYGKIQFFDNHWQISHPEFLLKKEIMVAIEPIYPLTYGLINKQLYGYIVSAINSLETGIKTRIAFTKINENEKEYLELLIKAIRKLHLMNFPTDLAPNHALIEQSTQEAIEYLSAKELFANQASLSKLKNQNIKKMVGNLVHLKF